MIANNFLTKFNRITLAFLSISITAFLVMRQTLANDAYIYFDAGMAMKSGKSPWDSSSNPYAQYLYGPISATLNSLSVQLPFWLYVLFIKLIGCILLYCLLLHFTRNSELASLGYLVLISSFSFRSNLQYGAVGGIGCILATYVILQRNNQNQWLDSISKLALFDFKPHIYWSLLIDRTGKKQILGFFSLAALSYLLINLVYDGVNPINWVLVVLAREEGLENDPTIIAPIFLGLRGVLPSIAFLLFTLTSVIVAHLYCRRRQLSTSDALLVTYSVAILTTPYLHTIDTLGILAILVIWNIRSQFFSPVFILLTLLISAWSNSLLANLAVGLLLCGSIWLTKKYLKYTHLVVPYLIFLALNYIWFDFLSQSSIPSVFYAFLTSSVACSLIYKVIHESR